MAVIAIDPNQIDFSLSPSLSRRIMRRLLLLYLSLGILCTVHAQTIGHAELTPPPLPKVKPVIPNFYSGDKNSNRIEDALETDLVRFKRFPKSPSSSNRETNNLKTDRKDVDVQLIFNAPITQKQMDAFLRLGGRIAYIYKNVSYGWHGRIPSASLDTLPKVMGSSLVLVHKPSVVDLQINRATKSGRVRPVWSPGFAGNSSGFDGDPTITIGIVDTGVDGNHIDLSGRESFWAEIGFFGGVTSGPTTSPFDRNGHGSHVAGIAVGSGLASCSHPSTLCYTQSQSSPSFFQLSTPSEAMVTFASQAFWIPRGNATLIQFQRVLSIPDWALPMPNSATGGDNEKGLFVVSEFERSAIWQYGALLDSEFPLMDYVIANSVEGFFDSDDMIRLRGVAPECNWAAVKLYENNEGKVAGSEIAIDVLVEARKSNNIKIMNLSLGTTAADGIVTRLFANNAARSGILVVAAAGNIENDESRPVHDPARAALALAVGAANSDNMLTAYSSHGRTTIDSGDNSPWEDFKPDLIAPGGSRVGSTIYGGIISVDSGTSDGKAFSDIEPNDYTEKDGTSIAAPFAAGCAGLVIDALQQKRNEEGYELNEVWSFDSSNDALFVKMVLCATATETNKARENDQFNPTLERAGRSQEFPNYPPGKDPYEGYGMINPDAAVEAVYRDYFWGKVEADYLGNDPQERRAWARRVYMLSNNTYRVSLDNPSTGDFDLYLYDVQPSSTGTPIIIDHSTNSERGADELIEFRPVVDTHALLVVKHVSGAGRFTVHAPDPLGPVLPPGSTFITDSNLKAAIETELGILDPSEADMLELTRFKYLGGSKIESIEGLQYAQNLEWLELYGNEIVDISPLASLTNLTKLDLDGNLIVDISPLTRLTKLTTLWIGYNQINDIAPLAGLTNLRALWIGYNQISDISPLAGLTNLTTLWMKTNQIVDISPLAGMTNLTKLDLSGNQVVDLSGITNLHELQELYLERMLLSEEARTVQIPEIRNNNPGIYIGY